MADIPQGQRGRRATANPQPDDPLTKLIQGREARGEAAIQPGGYRPGVTDRGPAATALAGGAMPNARRAMMHGDGPLDPRVIASLHHYFSGGKR